MQVVLIPTELLKMPKRARLIKSITELIESIKGLGIREPLFVRRIVKKFEVIDGARRLQAARNLGLVEVPCYTANQSIAQNEMAIVLRRLLKKMSITALAEELGVTVSWIRRKLK